MASLDRMISSSRRALEQRRGARPLAQLEQAVAALAPIRPFTEAVVGEEISFVLRVTEADPGSWPRPARPGWPAWPGGQAPPAGFEETSLPVLHRGVLIDPYQLYESRLGGADGVVLIAEAFEDDDESSAEMQGRRPARPGRRRPGRRRGGGRARPRAARPGLLPDPEPARRPGGARLRAHVLAARGGAGRQGRPVGGWHQHRDEVLALESAGVDAAILGRWVQRLGIASTLDILRGDTRE